MISMHTLCEIVSGMSVAFDRDPCPRTAIHLTQAQYAELQGKADPYTMEDFDSGLTDPVMVGDNDKAVYSLKAMMKHLRIDNNDRFIGNNLSKIQRTPMDPSRTFKLSNLHGVHYTRPDGSTNSEHYDETELKLKKMTGMTEEVRMTNLVDRDYEQKPGAGMKVAEMIPIVTDFINHICSQSIRNKSIHCLELAENFRDFAESRQRYIEEGQTTKLILLTIRTIMSVISDMRQKIIPQIRPEGHYILNPVTIQEFTKKLKEFCDLHEEVESYTLQSLIDKFKIFLDGQKIGYNGNNDKFFENMFISAADDRRSTGKIQVFHHRIFDASGKRAIVKTYLVANNMVSGSFSLH